MPKIGEYVEYDAVTAPVIEPIGHHVKERAEVSFGILQHAVRGKPWPLMKDNQG